jgi:hypothetical protein
LDDRKEVYGIVEAAGAEFFDEINGPAAMLVTRETFPQPILRVGERGGVVFRLVERTRPVIARRRACRRHDYAAGKVGKTVSSRSGKNLPPHRPKKIFNRDSVATLREQGLSIRAIASRVGVGVGTVARILQTRSRSL